MDDAARYDLANAFGLTLAQRRTMGDGDWLALRDRANCENPPDEDLRACLAWRVARDRIQADIVDEARTELKRAQRSFDMRLANQRETIQELRAELDLRRAPDGGIAPDSTPTPKSLDWYGGGFTIRTEPDQVANIRDTPVRSTPLMPDEFGGYPTNPSETDQPPALPTPEEYHRQLYTPVTADTWRGPLTLEDLNETIAAIRATGAPVRQPPGLKIRAESSGEIKPLANVRQLCMTCGRQHLLLDPCPSKKGG